MKNILIAYFSHAGENYYNGKIVNLPTGNTEIAAQEIARQTGGELFHIEQLKSYPADYHELTEVARQELRENARPEIKGPLPDLAPYKYIILGYPNWWGTLPMPVWTFLEAVDSRGKKIAPFCTNEGSGMGHSERDLRKLCPEAEILPGIAITGHKVRESGPMITSWLHGLDM